jgi:hypothetical protein
VSAVAIGHSERDLERFLLSFLALEGGSFDLKLRALLSTSLRDRLALCLESLEERQRILLAKRSIRDAFR